MTDVLRRPLSWFLTVCMLLIGSGAVHSLHELAAEGSGAAQTTWSQWGERQGGEHSTAPRKHQQPSKQKHDEDSCAICVTLSHLSALNPTTTALTGLMPIEGRILPTALHFAQQADVEHLNCRGPPTC